MLVIEDMENMQKVHELLDSMHKAFFEKPALVS